MSVPCYGTVAELAPPSLSTAVPLDTSGGAGVGSGRFNGSPERPEEVSRMRAPGDAGADQEKLSVRSLIKATVYSGPHSPGESPRRGGGPPLSVGIAGRAETLRRPLQGRGPSPRTKRRERPCSQHFAPLSNEGSPSPKRPTGPPHVLQNVWASC